MRDPKAVFDRWGRQLLVQGVDFAGQSRLHEWAAVLSGDASEVAQASALAAGRYLTGAGLGRAVAPSSWSAELQALDPDLQLLGNPAAAPPPVAQFYFATRPYGASVDVALTDSHDGWALGHSEAARVATFRYELGEPAGPEDAVAIGAFAAELLLADVLGLEPLPATVVVDLREPDAPTLVRQAAKPAGDPVPGHDASQHLLRELRGLPAVVAPISADCERNYPNEACGLLLRGADGQLIGLVCPNLQDRYHALDPAEFPRTARTAYKLNERLIQKAEAQGQTLVGIWHSHCDAGAYFSGEDVRCAAPGGQPMYPGVAYLVVSVIGGSVRGMAMYHFDEASGGFVAEPRA